jgi:site-specific DNA recombinase
MKRAVLYARVSTDVQQKEGTIDSQVLELKRQIAAAGDVLVREYVDDGYSGSLLDRPGLEALRSDVRTPLFDAVYFLDTDRIARDVAYQTIILGELIKHGKQIIIKGRDYVNNPENKFTITVLGAVAELERAKIIERTTRGRLHRLRMGELSSNGHRIYGYDYVRKTGYRIGRARHQRRAGAGRPVDLRDVRERPLRTGHHLALSRGAPRADPHGTAAVAAGSDQGHAQE